MSKPARRRARLRRTAVRHAQVKSLELHQWLECGPAPWQQASYFEQEAIRPGSQSVGETLCISSTLILSTGKPRTPGSVCVSEKLPEIPRLLFSEVHMDGYDCNASCADRFVVTAERILSKSLDDHVNNTEASLSVLMCADTSGVTLEHDIVAGAAEV